MINKKILLILLSGAVLVFFFLLYIFFGNLKPEQKTEPPQPSPVYRINSEIPDTNQEIKTSPWASVPRANYLKKQFADNYGFQIDNLNYVSVGNGDIYAKIIIPMDIEDQYYKGTPTTYYKFTAVNNSWVEISVNNLPLQIKDELLKQ
ncbi:MAG: hypothetical protein A2152_01930 [Candidatus Levybacteria bacterium RBG_16_35_6]|nr:MAG: hypothetical protein A2152_01930 [Candidatus Levybacteria bacterium RBG_16_35_6]